MALTQFLQGVRNGGMLIAPRASAEHQSNAATIEDRLRRPDLWLTPKTVEGFDANDFTYLTNDQKSALAKNVAEFRQVATTVPSDGPATRQQVAAASEPFREIYETVQRYFSKDFLAVRSAITGLFASGAFPDFVATFDLQVENDSTGDPAVWVWLIVDDAADENLAFHAIRPAQQTIADRLAELGIERFVYLSIRSVNEQREWLDGIYE